MAGGRGRRCGPPTSAPRALARVVPASDGGGPATAGRTRAGGAAARRAARSADRDGVAFGIAGVVVSSRQGRAGRRSRPVDRGGYSTVCTPFLPAAMTPDRVSAHSGLAVLTSHAAYGLPQPAISTCDCRAPGPQRCPTRRPCARTGGPSVSGLTEYQCAPVLVSGRAGPDHGRALLPRRRPHRRPGPGSPASRRDPDRPRSRSRSCVR